MNNRRETDLILRDLVAVSGESMEMILKWKRRVDDVQAKIQALDPDDPANQKQIAQLQFDLKILNLHTDRIKYWQDPRSVILDFIQIIHTELENYDKQHPARQSLHTGRLIEDIKQKVDIIARIQASESSLDELRRYYFALNGLLWESLDNISTDTDLPLEQTVLHILCRTRLNVEDARDKYSALNDRFSLPTLTEHQYLERQAQKYNAAYLLLDRTLRSIKNQTAEKKKLVDHAFDVSLAVRDFHFTCSQKQTEFDYKFYTAILECTRQLVVNPQNQTAKDQYHSLALLCDDGKGSLKGKIAGAMTTLIATIIVLSAGIAIQGGLAPLAPVCILGGSVLAISGLALFSASRSNGPHAATKRFESAVKKQPVAVTADERTPLLAYRR